MSKHISIDQQLLAALKYAERGFLVFPIYEPTTDLTGCSCYQGQDCDSPGKHPRTHIGFKAASGDKEQITKWWTRYPNANIGIATGRAVAVEGWLKSLKANGTKAKIREVFGAAFRHAMRHELYATNPIANVRQIRKRATDPSILVPSEIVAILKQLEGVEPVRTAFLIAAVMGMRRGEIFGLKWADLDLDRATLHVRRSYVDGVEGPPKTESSRRPLPLPPQAVEALKAWKEKSSHIKLDDWVFASEFHFGKQPLWPGTLWRRNVAPAIKSAEIDKPKLGWHTLRRSYASLLLSSGASLRVSMELMRHSTAEMTLATYAQTVGNEKRDAGAKVASLVLVKGENAA